MSSKEAYKQKIEAEVELAHVKLAELKAKVKNSAADARIEYENQIEDLEQKINTTNAKLKELSEASEDAWENLKDGVESAWSKLSRAVKDTAAKF
jgi:predicted  nucleic acid-binding Zn-ribbon protein